MSPAGRPKVPLEIRTERLILRAPHPDFAEELNAAIQDSFAELHAWMDWAAQMPTVDASRAQQAQGRERFLAREDLPVVIFRGDRVVGGSGLHRIDWHVPRFEIGYWVRTPDAHNGYVTEAVRALEALAFDELGARRVEIRCDTRNRRSRALAERLHYEQEGVLRNDTLHTDGLPRDTVVYSKVR